jgi:hypothetical protein|tara:strand:+ start:398 stop:883 length:486 start_codon:yes stop_codon:yes gene_type:complete
LIQEQSIGPEEIQEEYEIDDDEREFIPYRTAKIEDYKTVNCHRDKEETIEEENLFPDLFVQNLLSVDPNNHTKNDHILNRLDELKGVVRLPNKRFQEHIEKVFYNLIQKENTCSERFIISFHFINNIPIVRILISEKCKSPPFDSFIQLVNERDLFWNEGS